MKHQLRRFALATPALMAAIATVHAQERSSILEEIIITAEKREATLSDTALSISAYTSDTMKELNISNPADYEALVPSLTYQQSPNRISIRGVGRFDNSLGVNPGVGVYNDYAYTAEATALGTRPINTERVEILRGPQGTLYGRNTTGGAINIITKRPPQELTIDSSFKFGGYGTQEFDFLIGGPLSETFRLKFYANDIQHDGYQENISGEDIDTDNSQYFEGQMSWDITDSLNLLLKVGNLSYDYIPGRSVIIDGAPNMVPWDNLNVARSSLTPSSQRAQTGENPSFERDNPFFVSIDDVGHIELKDALNTTMHLTWDLENAQVKYIYNNNEYTWDQEGVDGDGAASDTVRTILNIGQYQDQTTHELQIVSDDASDFSWLAGLYYFTDENEQPYGFINPLLTGLADVIYNPFDYGYDSTLTPFVNPLLIGVGDNPNLYSYYQNGKLDSTSYAVYGEMGFDLSDTLALTIGLRYSEDKMEAFEEQLTYGSGALYQGLNTFLFTAPITFGGYDLDSYGVFTQPDYTNNALWFGPGQSTDTHEQTWDNVSGHITLEYFPSEDHLAWIKLANGYKMGGFRLGSLEDVFGQAALPDASVDYSEFDPEEVTMLELGWKATFSDIFQLDSSLYFYKYGDMQQLRSFNTGSVILSEVVNVDMDMAGAEFSANYLVTDIFSLRGSYSFNQAEIAEDITFIDSFYADAANPSGIEVNVKGNTPPKTPENKLSLVGSLDFDTDAGRIYSGLTVSYVGERESDIYNREETLLEDYTRIDLLASWTSPDEMVAITAAVKNLADDVAYDSKSVGTVTFSNNVAGTGTPRGYASHQITGRPMAPRIWSVALDLRF